MAQLDGQVEIRTKNRFRDAESAADQIGRGRAHVEGTHPNQRTEPIPALTSIRFFLAICVVCIHYRGLFLQSLFDFQLLNLFFILIVPGFYCLSGFILTYQYRTLQDRFATIKYFIARVARIVPLYWFCLFLALALGPASCFHVNSSSFIPILLANLFFVQSWFSAPEIHYAFNPPAYSLSAEAFMYLTFPFIIVTSTKKIWPWLTLSIFVVWLVMFFSPPKLCPYFFGIYPLTHMVDFVFGVAAARYFVKFGGRQLRDARLDFLLTSAVEIIAVVAFICWTTIYVHVFPRVDPVLELILRRCIGVFIFAILIFTLARQKGLLARLFGNKYLIALGEASFAIYLLHDIFLRYMAFHQYDLHRLGMFGFASFCVFTVAASYAAYRCIEQPWRRQIIQYADRFFPRMSLADTQNVPPPRPKHADAFHLHTLFPSKPSVTYSSALLLLPFLFLPLLPIGRWFIKALDELPFCQPTQGCTEVNGSQNVLFGDSVRLVNMYMRKCSDGIEIKAFWRAAGQPGKGKFVGVHIIDSNGSILGQADHELLPLVLPIIKGIVWCDNFKIKNNLLAGGKTIGLSVFENPQETFLIRGGHCDWGNHRLLLPLPAQ
jgi:peptidoglycan/LPS O-acetylase OafA/YrhL